MSVIPRLLSQGNPPFRVLRFDPAVPSEDRLIIRWQRVLDLVKEPCPIQRIALKCRATGKDSADTILQMAVEEADVENVAELSAGMRRGAEQVLANFRTFGRETRFSDMGAYSGGPRFMALTELVETVFRCPLPIERVGVGAQWEAQSIVDELRLALVETTVYQLLTLSDDYLEIGFHGAASGVDIDLPRIRKSGVVVRGLERRWSATGSMTRHLRMAHPRRFQQESKWEAVDLVQRRGKMMMRENLCMNEKIWAEVQGPNAGEASYSSPGNSAPSARE